MYINTSIEKNLYKMKLIIFAAAILISTLSFAQTDNTYIITINNSGTIANQKACISVLSSYFETKYCFYHTDGNFFSIETNNQNNLEQIQIDLENKGDFIIQSIKKKGPKLNHNTTKQD
tara:strand:+ start:547 stop:903 length:357 start_codon:yes stop_codon:yes gene_type:complete